MHADGFEATPDQPRAGRLASFGVTVRRFVRDPAQVLGLVLLVSLAVRLLWLGLPDGSLIFDESYYVNAARVILGIAPPADAHYADALLGFDPNAEHPPLGKALMALSMLVFGDTGVGWRLPSVLAGMVALGALYGIARAGGEDRWLAVLAVSLLSFETLSFVHGRIGTLDMLALAPALVGAWLGLRGHWGWSGVAFGLASMVKLTSVFGLGAMLIVQLVDLIRRRRAAGRLDVDDIRPTLLLLSTYLAVGLAGLWLLDLRFSPYPDPLSHLLHMAEFGAALRAPDGFEGIASYPWQWLVNEGQIDYLKVNVTTAVDGQLVRDLVTVLFRGAINPVLLGAAPLALLFAIWLAVRQANRAATWSIAWVAAAFLPYLVLVGVSQRITYLYYALPMLPAVALAVALLLSRSGLPRAVTWSFLGLTVLAWLAMFPFRVIP